MILSTSYAELIHVSHPAFVFQLEKKEVSFSESQKVFVWGYQLMIFNHQHGTTNFGENKGLSVLQFKSIVQTLLEDELVPVFLAMMFFFTVTIQGVFSQENCGFFTLL